MSYQLALATLSAAPGSHHTLRTVLVCDVVESVRWMLADEAGAVQQWRAFVDAVKQQVMPQFGGRMVKSLGDGLMFEFADAPIAPSIAISPSQPAHAPRAALGAAFAMQAIAARLSVDGNFSLRMGLHHTSVTVGDDDIYGIGVNLCARVASLAGPGEVMITAEMRDQLTDQLDADLQDMGECFLKHIDAPVRVYRAGPAGQHPILIPQRDYAAPLQAIVAVIPFAARSLAQDNQLAVGEIIADGVIGQLSRTRDLKVISRLSTSVFRNRINTGGLNGVADIESHLGANYVLSGSYIALDKTLIVTAELSETKTNHVIWMDRLQGDIGDLLQLQSELCHTIANATHMAILETEVQAALTKPLPTLESYSLLLGGISMMHRCAPNDFESSKLMLDAILDRHHTASTARAWLAKWYITKIIRGISTSRDTDVKLTLQHTCKILEREPANALALSIEGHALCQLIGNSEESLAKLSQALGVFPNESYAWLYKSVWSSMWGNAADSVTEAEMASALSPIDPMRYYFDTILAAAYTANAQYETAITTAKRSYRANQHHAPTLRAMLVAQVESELLEDANQTLDLLRLETPNITVSQYQQMGASVSFTRQRIRLDAYTAWGGRNEGFAQRVFAAKFIEIPNGGFKVTGCGSVLSTACGKETYVVGGYVGKPPFSRSKYSGAGPVRGGKKAQKGAEYLAPTDEGFYQTGLLCMGTRSGTWIRASGTSLAAPQVARELVSGSGTLMSIPAKAGPIENMVTEFGEGRLAYPFS